MQLKSLPFCDITQRTAVIPYRRFGKTYRSHLKGSIFPRKKPETRWCVLDRERRGRNLVASECNVRFTKCYSRVSNLISARNKRHYTNSSVWPASGDTWSSVNSVTPFESSSDRGQAPVASRQLSKMLLESESSHVEPFHASEESVTCRVSHEGNWTGIDSAESNSGRSCKLTISLYQQVTFFVSNPILWIFFTLFNHLTALVTI